MVSTEDGIIDVLEHPIPTKLDGSTEYKTGD
jgi:hypothetical protein